MALPADVYTVEAWPSGVAHKPGPRSVIVYKGGSCFLASLLVRVWSLFGTAVIWDQDGRQVAC